MTSSDPFDALVAGPAAVEPAARFRAELRNRLAIELELPAEITTVEVPGRSAAAANVPATRSTRHSNLQETTMSDPHDNTGDAAAANDSLVPYLCCAGAANALTFYAEVLGATETVRMVSDDGRVGHAEMRVGSAKFYLADEYPEMGVVSPTRLGGSPVTLQLRVADVDGVYDSALQHGAESLRAPADQFYGERSASITDPFGHRWTFSTPVEELSNEAMAQRSAEEGFTSTFGDADSETDPAAD